MSRQTNHDARLAGVGLTLTLGGRFEQVWQDYDDRNDPAPTASKDYAVGAGGVGATYACDENVRLPIVALISAKVSSDSRSGWSASPTVRW